MLVSMCNFGFLLALLLLCTSTVFLANVCANNCSRHSPLVGFTAELSMLQHQLRGQIEILDDCSFKVTKFDMITGEDVYWWGSKGEDFENLTSGFMVSDLKLNRTFNHESIVVYLANYTWEDFHVLSVWDKAFEADFGHVVLSYPAWTALAPSPSPLSLSGLAPSPASSADMMPSNDTESTTIYWGSQQPTMFENCLVLNPVYRLRWTLNHDGKTVDIGLEAAVPETHYMAFGWAQPGKTSQYMLNADVVLGGFNDRRNPFVQDFYITGKTVCTWATDGNPTGVCPDSAYLGNEEDELSGELKFQYGQWQDGVAFIRYQRPLRSPDQDYDVSINATDEMDVVWALGLLKSPDSLHPVYLPESHGSNYGHLKLNLSSRIDDCKSPLQAPNSDEPNLILGETGAELTVTAGPAIHYPNPPNPDKVIYLNKIESPVLKVERGVEFTFSIQAGHDVPFYITSNVVGGEPTNDTAIFAGGKDAHGVVANPFKLKWKPDRTTPDEVFYQSYYQKKMGWKIQVVDGGLNDMYNSSAFLADQMVKLYWMLTESGISFAVRGVRKSGYVAIGFGEKMVNTFAYVGWAQGNICNVSTYWIDGREASNIHLTMENITDVHCEQQNGMITFYFSRPLDPACTGRQECRNVIDPSIPLKVVWAMGTQWRIDQLSDRNMHSSKSSKYMALYLTKGIAEAEQELRPVLAVHGFIMFVAWALLFPGGVLAARYLKHLKNDGWFQIHIYAQYSGTAVMFIGVLFAVAEIREFHTGSLHVKLGLTSIIVVCGQLVNAFLRPSKAPPGEQPSLRRQIWQVLHKYTGMIALVLGFSSLFTGISELRHDHDGAEPMKGLGWALAGWFLCIALLSWYLEYRASRYDTGSGLTKGTWILDNNEDDTTDLLASNYIPSTANIDNGGHPSGAEIQLQPIQ